MVTLSLPTLLSAAGANLGADSGPPVLHRSYLMAVTLEGHPSGHRGAEPEKRQGGCSSSHALHPHREAWGGQRLLLSTLHGEEYEFTTPSSVAITELVALFLEGLKERSVFAMALQDQKATGAHWGAIPGPERGTGPASPLQEHGAE